MNIAEKLKEIGERWGILEYVLTVSHDQASNMEAAVRILTEQYNWQSLPCSAHKLQLCVLAGLNISAIDRLTAAVKKIVAHFRHSVVATVALKEKQEQMNISAKKLINSCATRWNSTYEMLERILKLRWPIIAVLSDESVTKRSDRYLDLKTEQWKLVEDLVPVLEPFSVATTFFSYEENVSISSVFAIVYGLLDHLEPKEESTYESKVIRDFKETVTAQIIERFELRSLHSAHPMLMGSLLDPRFKNITLSKFKEESETKKLKESLLELMDMYTSGDNTGSPSPAAPKKQKLTALDKLLGPEELMIKPPTFENELEKYLAESPISRKQNPLTWWRENTSRFKSLSCVAQRLLCMPATSTSSERIFSKAGLTVTKLRSCLKPKHVDALLFLNKNLSNLSMY